MVRGLAKSGEALDCNPEQALSNVDEVVAGLPGLAPDEVAMLQYAARLTLWPRSMRREHLTPLRDAGYDELGIHDIVQVVCAFNFMNRLSDGLGVEVLPARYELARELFGDEALNNHLEWARHQPGEALEDE